MERMLSHFQNSLFDTFISELRKNATKNIDSIPNSTDLDIQQIMDGKQLSGTENENLSELNTDFESLLLFEKLPETKLEMSGVFSLLEPKPRLQRIKGPLKILPDMEGKLNGILPNFSL
jgi:hypothetical protein